MKPHKTSAKTNRTDWVTPREILDPLGPFDLDPCCSAVMPWRPAGRMISLPEDGLAAEWSGRVWLNPPYGNAQNPWLEKLAHHGDGIALVPASTESKGRFFKYVWGVAAGVFFTKGRVRFYLPDGTRPEYGINQACCLIAYGWMNWAAILSSGIDGAAVMEVGR